jgi:hypothetical protein
VTLIPKRAVLTQEGEEFRMEAGSGDHRGMNWFRSPNISRIPTHPIV